MPRLYRYQREAVQKLHRRGGKAGLFMEMGTGKTRVSLVYLSEVKAERVLVVCPISAVGGWMREIRKLRLHWHGLDLTRGTLARRLQRLARLGNRARVVLVNYDVLWMPSYEELHHKRVNVRSRARNQHKFVQALMRWAPDSVVMDEVHRIKSRNSKQSRYAATLARNTKIQRRLGLTGTHITQGLQDLFAIYRFIDPTVFGTNYAAFESQYIKKGGYFNHQIVGYKNVEEAEQKVRDTAFLISKTQALDLPPSVTIPIDVEFEPASRDRYREFTDEFIAQIEGVDDEGNPLSGQAIARIALTCLLRQQQLTSGFINTDKGEIVVSDEKLRATVDIVHDALEQGHQVVIWCLFSLDVKRLHEKIKGSRILTGQTSKNVQQIEADFQAGKFKVLIAQIQAGSEGLDFTAATVGIFYSYDYKLMPYAQARNRIHRHGQTKKVTYYVMRVIDSVDGKVLDALGSKQDIARRVGNLEYARRLIS